MTTREFGLLLVLAQIARKILSRDDLYQALFNADSMVMIVPLIFIYFGCVRNLVKIQFFHGF